MTSYPREASARVKQKWLVEEFPNWLQERVTLLWLVGYALVFYTYPILLMSFII